jgi:dTDP-4-dehydrorhamnose reductase
MNNKKILVLGKTGQVAQAFSELISAHANFIGHDEADFLNPDNVVKIIADYNPSIIINAAAYTAVDKAESEIKEADLVNHQTPSAISRWAALNNCAIVHFSTDYVFDGKGHQPLSELAPTGPLNIYGKTKLAGELAIQKSGVKALIIRTSWVYSHTGKNFFKTMLRLGAEKEILSIVDDQIGSPTYAPDLAAITLKMVTDRRFQDQSKSEIYNVCGSGFCSWHTFATEIFRLAPYYNYPLKLETVLPIPSLTYPTPAERPKNSRLSPNKLLLDFNLEMPHWTDSLKRSFERLRLSSTD